MNVPLKVETLMSSPAIGCAPSDSLHVAAALMWRHDIGVVMVVDQKNHLQGVLTDRDIAMAAGMRGRPLSDIPVGETMSRDLFTCAPGDDVREAEQQMARHQVRRLPVVDGANHVVGILSLNDLACAVASQREPGVRPDEVAHTLHSVCRHRHLAAAT